jgi:hypothetical protein
MLSAGLILCTISAAVRDGAVCKYHWNPLQLTSWPLDKTYYHCSS